MCTDASFGPSVPPIGECRGGFDFTVTFEESIFSIAPACLLILVLPLRILRLWGSTPKTRGSCTSGLKLLGFILLGSLQSVLLAFVAKVDVGYRAVFLASTTLQICATIILAVLSYWEHRNTVRPSFLVTTYLFITCILDAARARTQALIPGHGQNIIAAMLVAGLVVKVIMFFVETKEKQNILFPEHSGISQESRSSILSRALFLWLNPLLMSGFRSVLHDKELPTIYEKLSSEGLNARVDSRFQKSIQAGKPNLLKDVLACFPRELGLIFIASTALVALQVCQPFLIQETVDFLASPSASINVGYGLIGGFFCVAAGIALVTPWLFHYLFRLTIMTRGALVSMIYSKLLQTTVNGIDQPAAFTLMTTDVENIVESLWRLVMEPWSCILQIAICTYLLYLQLGAICCVPILVIILTFVVVALGAGRLPGHQGAWFQAVESRIKLTSHTLSSMQSVKQMGLSREMEAAIQNKRKNELGISQKFRTANIFVMVTSFFPIYLSPLITFGAFGIMQMVSNQSSMSISVAVTSLSILNLITNPARRLLFTVAVGLQAFGSFARIQAFLSLGTNTSGESKETQGLMEKTLPTDPESSAPSSVVQTPTAARDTGTSERLVKPEVASLLEKHFTPGTITAVTGPTGCGTSTMLRSLLLRESEMNLPMQSDDIAYCSQTPWIHEGTVRDNIVGQSDWDITRYNDVIRSCQLDFDLKRMPDGELTKVGSMGLALSGGQRQRVAIARALYANKKRVILDDVISALDAQTSSAVVEQVFGKDGVLRKNGSAVMVGTHSGRILELADWVILMNKDGDVVGSGTYADLSARNQLSEQLKPALSSAKTEAEPEPKESSSMGEYQAQLDSKIDDLRRKKGDWRSYSFFISSMGWIQFSLFVLGTAVCVVIATIFQVWVTWWADDTNNTHGLGFWLGLYVLWAMLTIIGFFFTSKYYMGHLATKSSEAIHSKLLTSAMRAPMHVLSKTDIGSLINRFSQDIRLLDWQLPFTIILALLEFLQALASIGVAIAAVPYIAIAVPVLGGVLYALQLFYLRTSRQLRLLEIEMKAPIVSLFFDTIHGLTTIRAFGWAKAYIGKGVQVLDESQKPLYLLFCVQRWLLLVLSLIVAALQLLVIGAAIALRSSVSAGLVGLAIVQVATLTETLSDLIVQWTEVETSLGAVTRIFQFTQETPQEMREGRDDIRSLPPHGPITLENISATYDSDVKANAVLNNITLTVLPGEHVGICGRTGSGKSSLVSVLLRLLPCYEGRITIDGIDITTLDPETLRARLNVVTQQPFLFEGTVRDNMNPWKNAVADGVMLDALGKVNLGDKIAALGGLDAPLGETSLSHGQRQLFCLARALLRISNVLILDEPTGHIDPETDVTIQRVIRECFQQQTIIMIAHRLKSLLDFDRVVVLDSGRLVENGAPRDLLEDQSSAFKSLYSAIDGDLNE
ncbi:hypothetical protein KJ359_000853 [Pestalotiopsis sp. 9143b]|nr:hypothetical protein KJ359_000853 [Pestalotiopsis sp. 9143b]